MTRLLPGVAVMLVLLSSVSNADDVVPAAEPGPPPVGKASLWDGIYTEAQALRGAYLYPGPCGKCHGVRLDGAPEDPDMFSTKPIAGAKFLRDWDGRSLGTLFDYLQTTMPENNPGFLSAMEYADLVAFMLFKSGVPAGGAELRIDSPAIRALRIGVAP